MNQLRRALSLLLLPSEVVHWNSSFSSSHWDRYAAVLVCQTWDYSNQLEKYKNWLRDVSSSSLLFNPLPVILWNLNKKYMKDLEEKGVKILPTIFFTIDTLAALSVMTPTTEGRAEAMLQRERDIMASLWEGRGWTSIVIKPAVGCDAENIQRFDLQQDSAGALDFVKELLKNGQDTVLVQPFLPSILSWGEMSLIYIDSQYSHAVRKFPRESGEFRVQEKFGGWYEATQPSPEIIEMGRSALHTAKEITSIENKRECKNNYSDDIIYARVDMMSLSSSKVDKGNRDEWVVGEMELVEPFLYMSLSGPFTASNSSEDISNCAYKLATALSKRILCHQKTQAEGLDKGSGSVNLGGSLDVKSLVAVIRVDTHGNRFVVRDKMPMTAAKDLLRHYDSLTHHQGYYIINQDKIKQELDRRR